MSFEVSFFIHLSDYASRVLAGYDKFPPCFELHSHPGKDSGQELFAQEETSRKFS